MALSRLSIVQMSHKESEDALQKRLDEVSRELCRSQTSHASLRADAEKAQEQQQQMKGEWAGPGSASAGACVLSPRPPKTLPAPAFLPLCVGYSPQLMDHLHIQQRAVGLGNGRLLW